jgi:predicted RNase H-like nuclease (RuvC/YqgF family)
MSLEDFQEKRISRIEDVIERLTEISADLNKVLAVQEQRLSQNEKSMSSMEDLLEKRREEYEKKIQNVYDVMGKEDNKVLQELEIIRKEQKSQHDDLSKKINEMQKVIWVYMGGFSVIIFLITNGSKLLSLFGVN